MNKPLASFLLALAVTAYSPSLYAAEEGGFFNFMKKKENAPAAVESKRAVATPPAVQTEASAAAPIEGVPAPRNMGAENRAALMNRMANNKSLSEADKKTLVDSMLGNFPADADVKAAAYEKQTLFFEQVANDPNMKVGEKTAALAKGMPAAPAVAAQAPAIEPVVEKVKPVALQAKPVTQAPEMVEVVEAEEIEAIEEIEEILPVAETKTEPVVVVAEPVVVVKEATAEPSPVKKSSNFSKSNFSSKRAG